MTKRAKFRVSVIGCGYISERHFLSWNALPQTEIVAVCDTDKKRAEQRAKQFGISRVFVSTQELLEKVECNIIDITTRPDSHRELVTLAANTGKHILCQKPFASTLKDALAMIELCEINRVRLMICENWRWFTWYQKIKDVLEGGLIGKVEYALMDAHSWITIPKMEKMPFPVARERPYFQYMPKFVTYEMGVHLVDVLRFLLGEPVSVYARMEKMNPVLAGEDSVFLLFDFPGFYASLHLSWCSRDIDSRSGTDERLPIEGTLGSIILDRKGRTTLVNKQGERTALSYTIAKNEKLKTHQRLHRHFVEGILYDRPFQTDARDNIKTLEIILRAYEAARKNKVVRLRGNSLMNYPQSILEEKRN